MDSVHSAAKRVIDGRGTAYLLAVLFLFEIVFLLGLMLLL